MQENVLDSLKRQVERSHHLPLYQKKYRQAGFEPGDLKTIEDFQKLPFITRQDLVETFLEHPPHGGFMTEQVVRINFTPAPVLGLMPEYNTKRDIANICRSFAGVLRDVGVTSEDIVQNVFGYTVFIAGMALHNGIEELGAKAVPMGPGSTEQQVEVINRLGTTVLIANPSFAMKIGQSGGRVKILLLAGEPFISIDGYREKMKSAFGGDIVAADVYGLSEVGFISAECRFEAGLHLLTDLMHVEIVDPESGQALGFGDRGEVIISHIDKDAMPLIRFKTGDLSTLLKQKCACGKELTMPKGVFGRVDEMHKVKGVKFYPSQVAYVLASFQGLEAREYRVEITSEGGADRLKLIVKGNRAVVDTQDLILKLKAAINIGFNEIEVVEQLPSGPMVVDRRFS